MAAVVFAGASWRALAAADGQDVAARRLAWTLAAGAGVLAAEKLFRVANRAHEALHRLGVPDPPLMNGLDDVFLLAGLAIAATAVIGLWPAFAANRGRRWWLAVAGACACLSFAIDAFGPAGGPVTVTEEGLEIAMAAALLALAGTLGRSKEAGAGQARRPV
jgi:hypothetical protein